jgi:hypothetical protein
MGRSKWGEKEEKGEGSESSGAKEEGKKNTNICVPRRGLWPSNGRRARRLHMASSKVDGAFVGCCQVEITVTLKKRSLAYFHKEEKKNYVPY